nr:reverse transcriptase domain-containing protein [Tanacetum cinerariifolium]
FLEPLYPGSSSPVRSTTPPPDYPFDEFISAELDNSLWIIPRPLGSEPNGSQEDINICSTSINQAAIRKLVFDSVAAALEAQAATMKNTNNTNRNTHQSGTLVARNKLMKVFIGGLPRSIEGNVTALKPQTLEKAITITQRLMDQQCNLYSNGIVFLQQWELSSLAVGISSGSGNSITGSGNALCILFPTILP